MIRTAAGVGGASRRRWVIGHGIERQRPRQQLTAREHVALNCRRVLSKLGPPLVMIARRPQSAPGRWQDYGIWGGEQPCDAVAAIDIYKS
ncbi:MAG: hypothetical protein H6656_10125 [Ardenticatenaceae bacterium]|nr:hypothetical protein [Ardenticatenaceae bacterium]